MYSNLNDAFFVDPGLAPGNTKIWYMKPGVSRDLGMGVKFCKEHDLMPDVTNIEKTHTLLGSIAETDMDTIMCLMQGECWSQYGEARDLIKSKGLYSTSMSTGDIIEIDNKFFIRDRFEFVAL